MGPMEAESAAVDEKNEEPAAQLMRKLKRKRSQSLRSQKITRMMRLNLHPNQKKHHQNPRQWMRTRNHPAHRNQKRSPSPSPKRKLLPKKPPRRLRRHPRKLPRRNRLNDQRRNLSQRQSPAARKHLKR